MYPRSGFRSGETSAKTTLLETALSATPDTGYVGQGPNALSVFSSSVA